MSSTSGTSVVGTLSDIGNGRGVVRMEDVYDTDIDDLWSAVTDPSRLARWVAVVDGEIRLGGEIHTRFTSGWDGPGRIDVCEAPHHLVVRLRPGTADETVIEAVLTPAGAGTRLAVEERGIPIDELCYHGAGWQAHVEDLTAHLAGRDACDWEARWKELTPTYQDLAGRLA